MSNNHPDKNTRLDDPNCPYRQLLSILGDKWTSLVIQELLEGTLRYGTIKRRISGISHKMLAQALHKLEDKKLVERVVYPVTPPHVEYTLTPLGETLREPLEVLYAWAKKNEGVLTGEAE